MITSKSSINYECLPIGFVQISIEENIEANIIKVVSANQLAQKMLSFKFSEELLLDYDLMKNNLVLKKVIQAIKYLKSRGGTSIIEVAQSFYRLHGVWHGNLELDLYVIDISDEMKRLKHEKELIRSLNDIVFELDEDFIFRKVWTSGNELMLPVEQFIGRPITEIFEEAISKEAVSAFERARKKGRRSQFTYELWIGDRLEHYESRAVYIKTKGRRGRYIASVSNISELYEASKNLEKQIELDEILLEQTSALFDTSEEELTYVIDRLLERIGLFAKADRSYVFLYTKDMLFMNNTNEWCAAGVEPQIQKLIDLPVSIFPEWMKSLLAGEEIHIEDVDNLPEAWFEEREILKAQDVKSVLVIPIQHKDEHLGFMGFDFTRRGEILNSTSRTLLKFFANNLAVTMIGFEIKEQLQQKTLEAEKNAQEAITANKAKGDFISNISHEIRTPMNAIIGIAHLLDTIELNDVGKRYVQNIIRNSGALLEIINDILDFSKIESGAFSINSEEFSAYQLIEDSIRLFELQAADKNITLLPDIDKKIPALIYGAKIRIGQVLNNLMSNAIKYSTGGSVEIRCLLVEKQKRQGIQIEVTDEGVGIDEHEMVHLFEEFWQGSNAIGGTHGTGLGLPISKRILDMLGGSIEVSSSKGQGSKFIIWIPVEIKVHELPYQQEIKDLSNFTFYFAGGTKNRNYPYALLKKYGLDCLWIEEQFKYIPEGNPSKKVIWLIALGELESVPLWDWFESIEQWSYTAHVFFVGSMSEIGFFKRKFSNRDYDFLIYPVTQQVLFGEMHEKIMKKDSTYSSTKSNIMLSDLRILVVDDLQINQQILCLMLSQHNIRCDTAYNGKEALDAVKEVAYDLILMDVQMPVMDGIEATLRIKEYFKESGRKIPVIGVSAFQPQHLLDTTMDDYLQKPIEPAILLSTIEKWVHKEKDRKDADSVEKWIDVTEGVRLVGGDVEFYKQMLKMYLEEYKDNFMHIEELFIGQQWDELRRIFHNMQSISGCLGFVRVKQFIEKYQDQIRNPVRDLLQVEACHRQLMEDLTHTNNLVKKLLIEPIYMRE